MEDLIRRIEEARDGSRELDCKIFERLNPQVSTSFEDDGDGSIDCWYLDYETDLWPRIPEYTTSIDAALGLVPEGWRFDELKNRGAGGGDFGWAAKVWRCDSPASKYTGYNDGARPSTAALALTAAALKAIQEMER